MHYRHFTARRPAVSSALRSGQRMAACGLTLFCASLPSAHAQLAYSDVLATSFTGAVVANNGATAANKLTYLVAEDIMVAPGYQGHTIADISFSLGDSSATASYSVRPTVLFWDATGASGAPGTLLGGLQFTAIALTKNSVGLFSYASPTPLFTVPANGQFWVGMAFDAMTTTTTAANLNTAGQGNFSPPTVGTSPDELFQNTTIPTGGDAIAYGVNNPVGTIFPSPFGGAPIANFGYAFSTPGPNALAVLAAGGAPMLGLLRRRRMKS